MIGPLEERNEINFHPDMPDTWKYAMLTCSLDAMMDVQVQELFAWTRRAANWFDGDGDTGSGHAIPFFFPYLHLRLLYECDTWAHNYPSLGHTRVHSDEIRYLHLSA